MPASVPLAVPARSGNRPKKPGSTSPKAGTELRDRHSRAPAMRHPDIIQHRKPAAEGAFVITAEAGNTRLRASIDGS